MRAVVLAGGADQISLIQELKNRGYYTILIDFLENPVAKHIADKHVVASTLDDVAVRSIVKNEKANIVITACTDQALLTVAKVSDELSLPCYISYETALNVTNKYHMKRIFKQHGIPTSKFVAISDANAYNTEGLSYPLVVKPADCNSSKGVTKCFNELELHKAIKNAQDLSRTKTVIVEEYEQGIEISADFFIQDGNAVFLCATGIKKKRNANSFTITQCYYPALTEDQENTITEIGQSIARAFKLRDTPMLVQSILTEESNFLVLEFSARIGGGSKHQLIEVLSGVNIISAFVDLVFGIKPVVEPKKQISYASLNYVYCNKGIFDKLAGFADYINFQYKSSGAEIVSDKISSDRAAGFLLTANTREELLEKTAFTSRRIKVLDNLGRDIARHDFIMDTMVDD